MSFPRFPKYKASGVEWLGDVPEGWEVKPLRSVFKFSKGLTITKEDLHDEGVHCVNYGEVHSKYGFRLNPIVHPLRCVAPEYLRTNPEALIRDGDFVFADTSEDLEGSGNFTHLRSDNPIFAGYHTIIARPRKGTNSLLLAYQIHSSAFRSQIQRQVKGVKVFSISQGILKAAKCLLPPLIEQTAIAEFLDRETAKIDELVGEQRRLMELLKEKRQAVISHAVTKGLNPQAPMKPSGIEWLGDVPQGWECASLNRISRRVVVGIAEAATHAYASEGIPILRATNVRAGKIIGEILFIDPMFAADRGSKSLFAGDLVTVRTGNAGVTAIVPAEFDGCQCFTMLITSLHGGQSVEFFCYWMNSISAQCYFSLEGWGSAQVNISVPILKSLPVPIPPLSEQLEIVAYLKTELAKFDTLTAEAQRAIDFLQERRTALISAAVTGQIDVRDHAPKQVGERGS